jgi:hypothetical protein
VGINVIGPLPQTASRNQYLLVFVDYLMKWPEVFTLADLKAKTIAQIFIEQIICHHGTPKALLSDQGQQFLSKVLKEEMQHDSVPSSDQQPSQVVQQDTGRNAGQAHQ